MGVSFLAGATLVAHVTPFSECLLYSGNVGDKISYGSEYYCHSIGYLFLACIVGAIVMFYTTFKHRRELLSFYKSGNYTKQDQIMTISTRHISWHILFTVMVTLLTIAITVGYQVACNNIGDKLWNVQRDKLNKDPNLYRGEKIDERFTDDNQFWRYTGKISNPFGNELYSIRITCRTIFTDPSVHQQLHDNHVERYSNYFSYWYKVDLFSYNSQYQAVLTNTLVEASMAGGWLSVLVWGCSLVFMLIQKFYLRKEKREFDKVSLHSGMVDGSMRKDGSLFSGSGFYNGHHSSMSRPGTLQRGGLRGSTGSVKSLRSRRDMDDLAFASLHGVGTPGTQPRSHVPPPPRPQATPQFVGGLPINHIDQRQPAFYQQPHHQYGGGDYPQSRDHEMETEIM